MKILVTAGPTREFIDPVRFLSNRSSGKMGYAVARAAVTRNHEVILISGPVSLEAPAGAKTVRITTAAEMFEAVKQHAAWCDALVMAAAVADWRPTEISSDKLKKSSAASLSLDLERTDDILAWCSEAGTADRITVGFAAETGDPAAEAKRKAVEKKLDLVVANDVTAPDAGFEVDTNRAAFVSADGSIEQLPLMTKDELGSRIVQWIESAC